MIRAVPLDRPAQTPAALPPVLRIRGLAKAFGPTRALRGLSIDIAPGEIHGLIGRNGSGKSTLIKLLSGYHAPDAGSVEICGTAVPLPLAPGQARKHGLAFVHQDLGLVSELSVLENVRLGQFDRHRGYRIAWRREHAIAAAALERFGSRISPDALVGELGQVDRAIVAIVRGLLDLASHSGGGVLVLDEPTAYLPADGVSHLFEAVRTVAADGTSVLFVSHRLDEVRSLTDRISVLRDGDLVGTYQAHEASEGRLLQAMLGRPLDDFYPQPHRPTTEPTLTVSGLRGQVVDGLDLTLHRGETVGLTGIVGAGYDEVPYLLFGASPARAGHLAIGQRRLTIQDLDPRRALELGLALLPADRGRASGVPELPVSHNVSLPVLPAFFRGGRLRKDLEQDAIGQLLKDYDVTPPLASASLGQLSGGNQQKALLGKWLQRRPDVLLLHEPTQGVDVGAKKEIFRRLRDAAVAGASVLISSAEYGDLAHLCDRVVVFREGRPSTIMCRADLTEERLVEQCYRSESA